MPDGQYSFYLHSDDRTDIAAMLGAISTISQPLRGEFTSVPPPPGRWYLPVDARLPALIPVFCRAAERCPPLRRDGHGLRNTVTSLTGLPDEPEMGQGLLCPCHRRRNTNAGVTPDASEWRSGGQVESVLTEASSVCVAIC